MGLLSPDLMLNGDQAKRGASAKSLAVRTNSIANGASSPSGQELAEQMNDELKQKYVKGTIIKELCVINFNKL
jgi:hypothetical protein